MSDKTKETFEELKKRIIESIEQDGSVQGEDFDCYEIKIKGKKHLVAVTAPAELAWDMIKSIGEKEEQGVDQQGMYVSTISQCLVHPSKKEFEELCSHKPALKLAVLKVLTRLALGGVTQAKK